MLQMSTKDMTWSKNHCFHHLPTTATKFQNAHTHTYTHTHTHNIDQKAISDQIHLRRRTQTKAKTETVILDFLQKLFRR